MIKKAELFLPLEEAANEQDRKAAASAQLRIPADEISAVVVLKRSIDARSSKIRMHLICEVFINEQPTEFRLQLPVYKNVASAKRVLVIGAGPAGLFAALKLITLGLKPVVVERGKDVRSRRHDLAAINKKQIVNPDSNYCFGEGGAGTYSDGKLYTRSTKRGDVESVLHQLVAHGATREILVDTHPHIGTNKLPKIIQAIRDTIIEHGGEICFDTRMEGFVRDGNTLRGIKAVTVSESVIHGEIGAEAVILATGHSARDIFYLLDREKILIEPKPFALGLRIEHPQSLIDKIRYRCDTRHVLLPAASYALASQAAGRGVYSFCMCPGGFIVPAATAQGEVVVNGMSPSRRDSKYANSGIVVTVEAEDVKSFDKDGALKFLSFQAEVERAACEAAGGTQVAPAQRMQDFINGKVSGTLPDSSYQPGMRSTELSGFLPSFISSRLKEGFKSFGKTMPGYLTNDAVLLGVESRTSSPVRIPRNKITGMHPEIGGLFPCGEGAGYAGGIISAAIDGENSAESCWRYLK